MGTLVKHRASNLSHLEGFLTPERLEFEHIVLARLLRILTMAKTLYKAIHTMAESFSLNLKYKATSIL